jgi:hypothetical protein
MKKCFSVGFGLTSVGLWPMEVLLFHVVVRVNMVKMLLFHAS